MASAQNIRAGGAHVELWVNDRMTAGLRRASMSLRRFGRLSEDVSRRLLRAGTMMALPIAAAGRQFGLFEKQMAEVSTMLDAPSQHMERFSQEIIRMSIQFGKGTDELSKGLYNILSATIDASKAIEVLAVSSKAAVAGLTDTATAASTIAGVLNAYGLSAEYAEDVSDVLFTTVKRGQTTFAELSGFIGKVTSIAATAGVEFHELGAAIALVTRAGIPTEVALTGIRQALAKMVKPAHQSAVLFKKLFDMEMNPRTIKAMGGLEKFLLRVAKTANDEQTAILFPEVRALTSMLPLLRNTKELREDLEAMENRAGATQRAYDKMASTISHQFNKLKQAGKALLIVIGEQLAPVLDDLMKNLMRLVITSIHYIKHNAKLAVQFVFLTAKVLAAGVALKIFAVVLKSVAVVGSLVAGVFAKFGRMVSTIALVAATFKGLAAAVGRTLNWIEAFGAAVAVVIAWKAAMAALTVVTAGYAAVKATVVALTGTFGGLLGFMIGAVGMLTWGLLYNRKAFETWGSGLTTLFEDASMGVTGIVEAIKSGEWKLATEIAVDTMKLVWAEFWQWLKDGWRTAMEGVYDIVQDRKDALTTARVGGIQIMKDAMRGGHDSIVRGWQTMRRGLAQVHSGGLSPETEEKWAAGWKKRAENRRKFDELDPKTQAKIDEFAFRGTPMQAAIDASGAGPGLSDAEKAIEDKKAELKRKVTIAKIKSLLHQHGKRRDAFLREQELNEMLTKGTTSFDAFMKTQKDKQKKMKLPDLMPGNLDVGTGVAAGRMKTGALNAMAAIRLGMETGAPNSWVQRNTTANEQTAASVKQLLLEVQSFGVDE